MKNHPWIILCIITIIAGLALGLTNLITEGPIAEQSRIALQQSLSSVVPGAEFETLDTPEGLDGLYRATIGGETAGYVGQITVNGYNPGIVVVMAVDPEGKVMGIDVGGTSFAESPGFGTKTREPEFTSRFIGLDSAPVMDGNVDGISGVTLSSSGVIGGANKIYTAIQPLLGNE